MARATQPLTVAPLDHEVHALTTVVTAGDAERCLTHRLEIDQAEDVKSRSHQ